MEIGARVIDDVARPLISQRDGVHRNLTGAIASLADNAIRLPNRSARVLDGLHDAGPHRGRRRNVARLYVRLQLLLDHRNARAQFSRLPDRARARRHCAMPGAMARERSFSSTTTSRWMSAGSKRCAGRSSRRASTTSTIIVQAMTSPIAAARRDAGAADAAGRVPLCVPRNREHARRGSGVSARRAPRTVRREHGRRVGNATDRRRSSMLHRHGLLVVGGMIVGNPDDTREAIDANLEFAKRYVDWPYIQHPTPYPGRR